MGVLRSTSPCFAGQVGLKGNVGGHTHVVLVFGHGCDSVFVTAKLHVSFSGRLAVHRHVNVDPQWIQGREELRAQNKTEGQAYEFTVKSEVGQQEVSLKFLCAEITGKRNQSLNY